ncbi:hypothetical protein CDG81_11680 [Actinopolyspora erythraea]|uniref:Uncharacterized protein n=1 Tax=Actinopolyspora erythraea TaxID=414996 RepID=A0A099D7G7_9ACTN|nr:hypothetical protein [Actinopolyspora erythraea]ASU78830.1 hypothetical protein CDG81_11680 [Actinopolyspora erythraea]KGI81345.1 hypothetical protein IL38_11760 [Actinopolyspora erythraea]
MTGHHGLTGLTDLPMSEVAAALRGVLGHEVRYTAPGPLRFAVRLRGGSIPAPVLGSPWPAVLDPHPAKRLRWVRDDRTASTSCPDAVETPRRRR